MEQKSNLPVCLRLGPGQPLFTDATAPREPCRRPRPNPRMGKALPLRFGVGSAFLTLHLLETQAATSSGAMGPAPGQALTTLIWFQPPYGGHRRSRSHCAVSLKAFTFLFHS